MPDGGTTTHLYRPKLLTTFSEGYRAADLRHDAMAGLTVSVIALPLSMAIAVASGVSPERGIYTAVVGGFLVSALGGSRFQVGGPAGAFILLVSAAVAQFGIEGLLLAVLVSGVLLSVLGLLGLGSLVRHIPHSVTVGFTCAIAVTIAASQLKDLAGLHLGGAEPGPLLPKLAALKAALGSFNGAALAVGAGVVATILVFRRFLPSWPGMLIAILAASMGATMLGLPVETVGSRFGELSRGFPAPTAPTLDWPLLIRVFPSALSFTLLGAVESLLSAKVADGMTGRKHRSNMELVAQGVANVASAFFGGICVTGTIARTAANIRAGARSPVSGILHAAFLLVFLVVAAPLVRFIPLAALAGVLLVVAWNMAEKLEFLRLLRQPGPAAVLLATFGVTILEDLTAGIIAGCLLAVMLAGADRLRTKGKD